MAKTWMFQAKEKTIWEILFWTDTLFRIPEYQRPYSRGLDEANDFWNDIVEDNSESYFLWSFVLNKNSDRERIDIIDWQQRTLTITIFIAVIRDYFRELWDNDSAEEIQRDYICKTSKLKWGTHYKIIPWDTTKDYFQKIQDWEIILSNDSKEKLTKEWKLLKTIYNFFKDKIWYHIKSSADNKKKDFLINLLDKVIWSECIEIVVNDENIAYTIFETVNARWADLSVSDLVKNIFFKHYDQDGKLSDARKLWKELEDNINECGGDISMFLRHYRLAKHGYISKRDLFKKIKLEIESNGYNNFLKELVETSNFYKIILNPSNFSKEDLSLPIRYWTDYEKQDNKELTKIYQSLLWIGVFKIKQYAPIFLSIFKNYRILIENARPTNIIENIERFWYSFFWICSQPARAIEKECSRFSLDIWNTCTKSNNIMYDIQKVYAKHKEFLKENFPKFELFKENFINLSYKKLPLVKYTLQKISNEIELEDTLDDNMDYAKLNVEHILPQKPQEWWYNEKEVAGYVNSIWNLTLIWRRMNSIVWNKPLKEKTENEDWFHKTNVAMLQRLVQQFRDNDYKWDRESIEKRTEELSRKIYDIQTIK